MNNEELFEYRKLWICLMAGLNSIQQQSEEPTDAIVISANRNTASLLGEPEKFGRHGNTNLFYNSRHTKIKYIFDPSAFKNESKTASTQMYTRQNILPFSFVPYYPYHLYWLNYGK